MLPENISFEILAFAIRNIDFVFVNFILWNTSRNFRWFFSIKL